MPTLEWIGKAAVLNHHREVPFRLLKNDARLSVGDPGTGNLLYILIYQNCSGVTTRKDVRPSKCLTFQVTNVVASKDSATDRIRASLKFILRRMRSNAPVIRPIKKSPEGATGASG
ncbi:MAG: hypothetical protein EXS64_01885 [Candidatus Latescibacteria bacterium]|nr:hypothetical protein [Candidatus Latescibacterota bacterium]